MNKIFTFFRESYLARFLIPFGIICIIVSIFMFISIDHNKNYIKVDSIVSKTELVEEEYTDIDGNHHDATYRIFVKYTVDGRNYEEELGEFSGFEKGDKIVISYNPEDPTQIAQPIGYIVPSIICAGGVVALVAGIISIIRVVKRHKAMKVQEEGWNKNE